DGEHRPAAVREGDDVLHHGAEPRDRAGPQVIAVTEAAGQDDHVAVVQVVMLVPEKGRPFAESVDDGTVGVVVAVRAGKGDDAELHAASTVAISKSSVTGFASRRSHMARASRSADCWSPASSSSTMYRPTWTSRSAPNPRVCSASATALPCGSRMPRRGVMCTAMRYRFIRSVQ